MLLAGVILLFFFANVTESSKDIEVPSIQKIVQGYGYPLEEHHVVTKDRYVLGLHRIPYGRRGRNNGQVVFLMHGILCSSMDWIINSLENSLAFNLADEGYDVWMGNARGNTYSRKHVFDKHLDAGRNFWDFSWHEIGTIDVPAMIDYILEKTKQSQIFHVGFSQGTTSFYVMTSSKPEYNQKIKAHFSLAPVAYMSNSPSGFMRIIAKLLPAIETHIKIRGPFEFLATNQVVMKLAKKFCSTDNILTRAACTAPFYLLGGRNPSQMNVTNIPFIAQHTPAGGSIKQATHYVQEYKSGHFRQYDYGTDNFKIYGLAEPPDYNLSAITAPINLYHGENDVLSPPANVQKLAREIKSVHKYFTVEDPKFSHLDFLYGTTAYTFVNRFVIEDMRTYW